MQNIDSTLIAYLEKFLKQHYSQNYNYETFDEGLVEIQAVLKTNERDRTMLLRYGINHHAQQIFISNIFIPAALKHNGIGKKLILLIYTIAQNFDYDVFVVQLVDGFKARLLSRGAVLIDEDTVLITGDTNLL